MDFKAVITDMYVECVTIVLSGKKPYEGICSLHPQKDGYHNSLRFKFAEDVEFSSNPILQMNFPIHALTDFDARTNNRYVQKHIDGKNLAFHCLITCTVVARYQSKIANAMAPKLAEASQQ